MNKISMYVIGAIFMSLVSVQSAFAANSYFTQSMLALTQTKAFHITGEATMTTYPSSTSFFSSSKPETTSFTYDGRQDITTPGNVRMMHRVGATGGMFGGYSVELRVDGETVYIKIPATITAFFTGEAPSAEDFWIRISPNDITALKNDLGEDGEFAEDIRKGLSDFNKQPTGYLAAHQADWIPFTQAVRMKATGVKGVYSLTVDKAMLRQAMIAQRKDGTNRVLTKTELASIDADIASSQLRNGKFSFVPNSKLPAMISGTVDSLVNQKVTSSMNFKVMFSEYNVPFAVTVPSPTKSIVDIFKEFIAPSLEAAQQKGAEASIRSSLSDFRAHAELVYDESNGSYGTLSNNGSCTSPRTGSLFNPSTTSAGPIRSIVASISKNTGVEMRCNSTPERYAFSVKIPDTDTYWCVDSSGSLEKITRNIGGTSCK